MESTAEAITPENSSISCWQWSVCDNQTTASQKTHWFQQMEATALMNLNQCSCMQRICGCQLWMTSSGVFSTGAAEDFIV